MPNLWGKPGVQDSLEWTQASRTGPACRSSQRHRGLPFPHGPTTSLPSFWSQVRLAVSAYVHNAVPCSAHLRDSHTHLKGLHFREDFSDIPSRRECHFLCAPSIPFSYFCSVSNYIPMNVNISVHSTRLGIPRGQVLFTFVALCLV